MFGLKLPNRDGRAYMLGSYGLAELRMNVLGLPLPEVGHDYGYDDDDLLECDACLLWLVDPLVVF